MDNRVRCQVRVKPSETFGRQLWQASSREVRRHDGLEFYNFDHVYDGCCDNAHVYESGVSSLVGECLDGFNASILAYGQSGSGKTHTLTGNRDEEGVVQLAFRHIIDNIAKTKDKVFMLRLSVMEIYNEKIRDLLGTLNDLQVHDDAQSRTVVQGLKEVPVRNMDDMLSHLAKAQEQRQVNETALNERSSRSHVIVRLQMESRKKEAASSSTLFSTLSLVDLAGSENAAVAKTSGTRLKEGIHINRSLFTLTKCINQLSENQPFISFRDSKLTRMLKSSLGGNSKTLIICTINCQVHAETSSTLKFAKCAVKVENTPKVNENEAEEGELDNLLKQIDSLKKQLENRDEKETKLEEKTRRLEELKNLILIGGESDKTAFKAKKNRRQTWAPGRGGDSFFPPFLSRDKEERRLTGGVLAELAEEADETAAGSCRPLSLDGSPLSMVPLKEYAYHETAEVACQTMKLSLEEEQTQTDKDKEKEVEAVHKEIQTEEYSLRGELSPDVKARNVDHRGLSSLQIEKDEDTSNGHRVTEERRRVAESEKELQELGECVQEGEKLRSQITHLTHELEMVRSALKDSQTRCAKVRHTVVEEMKAAVEDKMKEDSDCIRQLMAENESLQEKVNVLVQAEQSILMHGGGVDEGEVEVMKKELGEALTKIAIQEASLAERDEYIEKGKKKMERLAVEKREAEHRIASIRDALHAKDDIIQRHRSESNTATALLKEKETDLLKSCRFLQEQQAEGEEMREMLKKAEKESKDLKSKVTAAEQRLEEVKACARQEKATHEKAMAALKRERDSLEAEKNRSKSEAEQQTECAVEYTKEVQTEEEEDQVMAELLRMTKEYGEYREEMEKKEKDGIKKANERIDFWKGEVDKAKARGDRKAKELYNLRKLNKPLADKENKIT